MYNTLTFCSRGRRPCLRRFNLSFFCLDCYLQVSAHLPQICPSCHSHDRIWLHQAFHNVAGKNMGSIPNTSKSTWKFCACVLMVCSLTRVRFGQFCQTWEHWGNADGEKWCDQLTRIELDNTPSFDKNNASSKSCPSDPHVAMIQNQMRADLE